jgi:hypothetical protein
VVETAMAVWPKAPAPARKRHLKAA